MHQCTAQSVTINVIHCTVCAFQFNVKYETQYVSLTNIISMTNNAQKFHIKRAQKMNAENYPANWNKSNLSRREASLAIRFMACELWKKNCQKIYTHAIFWWYESKLQQVIWTTGHMKILCNIWTIDWLCADKWVMLSRREGSLSELFVSIRWVFECLIEFLWSN